MSVGTRKTSQEASPTEREWGLDVAAAEGPTATPGTCSRAPVTKVGKGDMMTQRVLLEGTLKTRSSTFPLLTEGRGHGCRTRWNQHFITRQCVSRIRFYS